MKLGVEQAALLLHVSKKTIYRWVGDGKLPGYRVNQQFRFDRSELLEWATAHRIAPSPQLLQEPADLAPVAPFHAALDAGGIHYRVGGRTVEEVLRNVVGLLRPADDPER